ncbi:hypothetical protein K474DRAFT_1708212 [Panus rudis PR-1116 ss-1]|nr:hypothetical protein K474DRAFT_1708212 [Panus rudis PR-1116 ss-1]
MSTDDIDAILRADPPRRHEEEWSDDGPVNTAVSQPLPVISTDEAIKRTFVIADVKRVIPFEVADYIYKEERYYPIPPEINYPSPELIFNLKWDGKMAIWALGCMGNPSIYQVGPWGWHDPDNAHYLWQLMTVTGEDYKSASFRSRMISKRRYLTLEGDLKTKAESENTTLPYGERPLENILEDFKVISGKDFKDTTAFIRRYLRLDPEDRPTAEELMRDSFFDEVD